MMAADLLHASVHRFVPSGVSFCWPLSRCRAYSADAFALHFALSHGLHLGLHSAQPTNVQMPCREHGRSVAVAVFASALAACAAAPPGRSCREWMREANAEGKTKGGGTGPPAKPVCTWGGAAHACFAAVPRGARGPRQCGYARVLCTTGHARACREHSHERAPR